MATFVLVHGAWGGGWEWRDVEQRLRALGHEASRPTLTGLGERRHLLSPTVTLDTHVEDVVQHFELEDLRDVILCGHSYGGMVVTGVADRIPERVRRLVYIDAFIPQDGESLFDLLPREFASMLRGSAIGSVIPVPFPFEQTAATRGAWYAERTADHPLGTMEQPLRLEGRSAEIPRFYIRCVDDDAPVETSAERARAAGWEYHELATHHDAQIGDPAGLTELLLVAV